KDRHVTFYHLLEYNQLLDANDQKILSTLMSTNDLNKTILNTLEEYLLVYIQPIEIAKASRSSNNNELKNIYKVYKDTFKMTKKSLKATGMDKNEAQQTAITIARAAVQS
ncbi:hypothetical protein, partial [Salmonella sp. s51228]|uniref:hypothetical protein n=1 Tax=Salmonella sp. s51228 TaxID=3159652 RepID=UPI0039804C5D